jgi:streptogramin lyase
VVTVGAGSEPFAPNQLALGADGRLYADGCTADSETCNLIIALTTSGKLSSYPTPSGDKPDGQLVRDPNGAVWFPETEHIGKISTSGAITEYAFDGSTQSGFRDAVTVGPDGNVWFSHNTEDYYSDPGWIGKITPSTGAMAVYPYHGCLDVQAIVPSSSHLYVLCLSAITAEDEYYSIASITPSGVWGKLHSLPAYARNSNMIMAPDNTLWFAACLCYASSGPVKWGIGRFAPANGRFGMLLPPRHFPSMYGALAVGPDDAVWTTVSGDGLEPSAFVRYGPVK